MSLVQRVEEIKTDLINSYNEISNKNGTIPEKKNLDNLSEAIKSIPKGEDDYEEDWQPDPSWYDIETILEEDNEKMDDGSDYPAKAIVLFFNDTSAVTLGGANKYKTSDGEIIAPSTALSDTNITFNGTGDKQSDYGYKTRYVICYYNKNTISDSNKQYPKFGYTDTRYIIIDNLITNKPGLFNGYRKLQAFKFKNGAKISGNSIELLCFGCYELRRFWLFDTSTITNFKQAFGVCYNLKVLNCEPGEVNYINVANATYTGLDEFLVDTLLKKAKFNFSKSLASLSDDWISCYNYNFTKNSMKIIFTNKAAMFYDWNENYQNIDEINFLQLTSNCEIPCISYTYSVIRKIVVDPLSTSLKITMYPYGESNSIIDYSSLEKIENISENIMIIAGKVKTSFLFENFIGNFRIDNNWDISESSRITQESLLNIINCLRSGVSNKLTLGDLKQRLTADEIAIATSKKWTVS